MSRPELALRTYIKQIENGSTEERRDEKLRLVDDLRNHFERAIFKSLNCSGVMCTCCIDRLISALGKAGEERLEKMREGR